MTTTETIKLGRIGVDSGTMMLCDPCYVIGKETKDWTTVCEELKQMEEGLILNVNDHNFANGAIFSTGGDGSFPVELEVVDLGKRQGKRVVSAKITFIEKNELHEWLSKIK
jgi:hypothetical protein